jgi:uncharacterized protein
VIGDLGGRLRPVTRVLHFGEPTFKVIPTKTFTANLREHHDSPLRPTLREIDRDTHRIAVLDVLRGAAMFGVLFVNLMVFVDDAGVGVPRTALDRFITEIRDNAFNGKCYLILATVFGYSLGLQMRVAGSIPDRRRALTRRLVGLTVLGLAHGLLLYRFDILFAYGILGYLAYRLRHTSSRTIGSIVGALLTVGTWALLHPVDTRGLARYGPALAVDRYRNGTLIGLIQLHLHNHLANVTGEILSQWPFALAAILLGLLGERYDLMRTIRDLRLARTTLLLVGLISTLIIIAGTLPFDLVPPGLLNLVTPVSAFGFDLGAITVIATRVRISSRFARSLSLVGRMSLSVYLMQSIVCATVLYGFGLGLADHFSPTVQALFSVTFFAVQVAGCHWWLRSHRRGPVEALLRRCTGTPLTATREIPPIHGLAG